MHFNSAGMNKPALNCEFNSAGLKKTALITFDHDYGQMLSALNFLIYSIKSIYHLGIEKLAQEKKTEFVFNFLLVYFR